MSVTVNTFITVVFCCRNTWSTWKADWKQWKLAMSTFWALRRQMLRCRSISMMICMISLTYVSYLSNINSIFYLE